MRDLSLHILDLMENSIRAGASIIAIAVEEHPERDLLKVVVEDNGPGLDIPSELATDPFYTTKGGKRTGLGLSLFRAAAERAGGRITVGRSPLGGAAIEAVMQLSHVDRSPLGDLTATVSSVVCTNPQIDLWCRFCVREREWKMKVSELARNRAVAGGCGLSIAREVHDKMKQGLESLEVIA